MIILSEVIFVIIVKHWTHLARLNYAFCIKKTTKWNIMAVKIKKTVQHKMINFLYRVILKIRLFFKEIFMYIDVITDHRDINIERKFSW
jgi:hypothetical protein